MSESAKQQLDAIVGLLRDADGPRTVRAIADGCGLSDDDVVLILQSNEQVFDGADFGDGRIWLLSPLAQSQHSQHSSETGDGATRHLFIEYNDWGFPSLYRRIKHSPASISRHGEPHEGWPDPPSTRSIADRILAREPDSVYQRFMSEFMVCKRDRPMLRASLLQVATLWAREFHSAQHLETLIRICALTRTDEPAAHLLRRATRGDAPTEIVRWLDKYNAYATLSSAVFLESLIESFCVMPANVRATMLTAIVSICHKSQRPAMVRRLDPSGHSITMDTIDEWVDVLGIHAFADLFNELPPRLKDKIGTWLLAGLGETTFVAIDGCLQIHVGLNRAEIDWSPIRGSVYADAAESVIMHAVESSSPLRLLDKVPRVTYEARN